MARVASDLQRTLDKGSAVTGLWIAPGVVREVRMRMRRCWALRETQRVGVVAVQSQAKGRRSARVAVLWAAKCGRVPS